MTFIVPNCSSITSAECGDVLPLLGNFAGSWDDLFCICSSADVNLGVCDQAPTVNWYAPDGPSGPEISEVLDSLVGVYSTNASAVTIAPSTSVYLSPTQTWQNTSNALSEDGTFATLALDLYLQDPLLVVGQDTRQWGCGSDYIVVTGFGFSIPPDALVLGIVVGVKGKSIEATGFYNSGAPRTAYTQVGVFNMALTFGGVMYYFADPRSDTSSQTIQGSAGDTILVAGPFSSSPYFTSPFTAPVSITPAQASTFHRGDLAWGNQFLGGPHNGAQTFGWPVYGATDLNEEGFLALGGNVNLFSSTANGMTAPNGVRPAYYPINQGRVPVCDPNNFIPGVPSEPGVYGPMEKGISISQLKQNWSGAQINDPSFGVAVSLYQSTQVYFPGGHGGGYTAPGASAITAYLDCFGIAVYYTQQSKPTGNPFAPCVPTPGCS